MPGALPPILGAATALDLSWGHGRLVGSDFLAHVHGAASVLRAQGVEEGSRVAVDSGDAASRLCWFLGADLVGAATMILEPAWTDTERQALLDDVRPTATVTGMPPVGAEQEPAGDARTKFYLPTTSGSSGRPKVLVRTRRSWTASFEQFDSVVGSVPGTVLVPGPLSSSLFLFGTVHALHQNQPVHLLERWSARQAAEAATRGTVIHLVPAMLAGLLAVWERDPGLHASNTLRRVVCGGARLDQELRNRVHDLLPDCELVEYYGSAEHSMVAVRTSTSAATTRALRPLPAVEVQVRDPETAEPLSAGVSGQLWVRSELVYSGYLDDGVPRPRGEGWSGVGDLATLEPDGSLYVHGRASAAIVSTGGALVSAEEVEETLRQVVGVRDVVVAATPHDRLGSVVTALVEADGLLRPQLRELRARARATLAPAKRPRRWLLTSALPRTASGKPARATVSEQLREGTIDAEELR